MVTPRFLAGSISQTLYSTSEDNANSSNPTAEIDPTIKVSSRSISERLDLNKRYQIPDSEWFPGYFQKQLLDLKDVFESPEFEELLVNNEIISKKLWKILEKRRKSFPE